MLSVLTFGALASGIVLGLVSSSKNPVALLLFAVGMMILFPIAAIATVLSVGLPLVSSIFPPAGVWGGLLTSYVGSVYGIPGWYYLVGSIPLCIIGIFQFADEDAGTGSTTDSPDEPDSPESSTATDDTVAETEDHGSKAITDIDGIGSKGSKRLKSEGFETVDDLRTASPSELTSIEGLDTQSAKVLKSRVGDANTHEDNVDLVDTYSESLDELIDTAETKSDTSEKKTTDDTGQKEFYELIKKCDLNEQKVSKLNETGYETYEDIAAASESDLSLIVGLAHASRLKNAIEGDGNATETESPHETVRESSKSDDSENSILGTDEKGDDSNDDEQLSKSDYEHLMSVNGVDDKNAKKLYQAGYKSIEDLQTARQRKLANVVGSALSSLIKTDVREAIAEIDDSARSQKTKHQTASESDSVDEDIGHEDIEDLLELPDVGKTEAKALYDQGFRSTEDLRTAGSSEVADVVGYGTMVSIRDEVGFVSQNTHPDSADGENQSSDVETSEASTESEGASKDDSKERVDEKSADNTTENSPADTDEITAKLEKKKQEVDSQLDEAMAAPFDDIDSTQAVLVGTHTLAAELGETADENNHDELRSYAEETLNKIETNLDILSAVTDPLKSARSRVPPEKPLTDSITLSALKSARDSYSSAIETAEDSAFDTGKLEDARDEITATIDQRSEETASSNTSMANDGSQKSTQEHDEKGSDDSPTRQDLITELNRLDAPSDGYPMTTHMDDTGQYSPQQYYEEFGKWESALEAAGIDKEQRLIDDIKTVAKQVSGTPSTVDMNTHGAHSSGTYSSYFGSWSYALKAAGLSPTSSDETAYQTPSTTGNGDSNSTTDQSNGNTDDVPSTEAYIDAIQRYAETTDSVIKSTEFSDFSSYSRNEIVAAFGSWQEALDAAEVDNQSRLINELRRVAEKLGHQPSTTEMNEHGTVSATLYANYFESYTIAKQQAFSDNTTHAASSEESADQTTATTGNDDSNSSIDQSNGNKDDVPSTEAYIDAIQRYAETTDSVIKSTDFSESSGYSTNEIVAAFGSWQEALDAAEVDNQSRLIDELHRVADKLGHQPSTTEMNEHGTVSATLYADYFENYTTAKQQAFSDNTTHAAGVESQAIGEQFTQIIDLTDDGRIDRPIAIKVCHLSDQTGNKKDESMRIEDLNGDQCWLHIWKTHEIDLDWERDKWYILEEARGKQWTNSNGVTKQQLSSTKDLRISKVGNDQPIETDLKEPSGKVGTTAANQSGSSDPETDTDEDSDDILEDIVTEFDELSK